MTKVTIWNILGMIGLTPWTQGSFFYFLGPCLLPTTRNTRWMDIHEIFRIWTQEALGYTVSRLSRLFHALQTSCGTGLCSLSASCLCWDLSHSMLVTGTPDLIQTNGWTFSQDTTELSKICITLKICIMNIDITFTVKICICWQAKLFVMCFAENWLKGKCQ